MKFDVSAYLILGRENTNDRSVKDIVKQAVQAGFTFIQVRSKQESALELIEDCRDVADALRELGKSQEVALVVDDRLDVVLAAREQGIKVDGIHVGQTDIPVSVCRKYLGPDSIIGLSAPTKHLIDYVKNYNNKKDTEDKNSCDSLDIDYFGAGPVHETSTKPDCGMDENGKVITKTFEELTQLAEVSPVPVVVGGGVKAKDIADLKKTGVDGFFVVSAVTNADNPYKAAEELVDLWNK